MQKIFTLLTFLLCQRLNIWSHFWQKKHCHNKRSTKVIHIQEGYPFIQIQKSEAKYSKTIFSIYFADPRCWLREDVQTWIRHLAAVHGLPAVQPDRFLMNGKALCLMTMEMFCQRVPLGGKMLYKDFQLRLSMALYGNNNKCWKKPDIICDKTRKSSFWPKKMPKFIQDRPLKLKCYLRTLEI